MCAHLYVCVSVRRYNHVNMNMRVLLYEYNIFNGIIQFQVIHIKIKSDYDNTDISYAKGT